MKEKEATLLNGVGNSAKFETPYSVDIEITGAAPLLFHKWDCEVVEQKAKARKGSSEKKTDNLESFIYRNQEGFICLPGEYLRMAMVYAAKFKQDPRSPRKAAFDLFKAGVISLTDLAPLNGGVMKWDFLDQRRVVVQRSGITRMRPAFHKGWTAEFIICVNTPEYIDFQFFYDVLQTAGRLIGVGDFRPTYGRFDISRCKTLE